MKIFMFRCPYECCNLFFKYYIQKLWYFYCLSYNLRKNNFFSRTSIIKKYYTFPQRKYYYNLKIRKKLIN